MYACVRPIRAIASALFALGLPVVMLRISDEASRSDLILVQNFFEELRERVGS